MSAGPAQGLGRFTYQIGGAVAMTGCACCDVRHTCAVTALRHCAASLTNSWFIASCPRGLDVTVLLADELATNLAVITASSFVTAELIDRGLVAPPLPGDPVSPGCIDLRALLGAFMSRCAHIYLQPCKHRRRCSALLASCALEAAARGVLD